MTSSSYYDSAASRKATCHITPMYQPPANREERRGLIPELIRQHPLGLLISAGHVGLQANSVPFVLKVGPDQSITLECHLAIANPQWREFEGDEEVLIVFQGPQAYVTPTWYPAKREHGKVVPTWNYVVVQVKGTAFTVDDPDWLSTHLNELTDHNERELTEPWRVADAPEDYVTAQMKGIKGVRIQVSSVTGK